MKSKLTGGVCLAAMMLPTTVFAEPVFNRIASFPVTESLPEGIDPGAKTSAEIITATPDGMTLIFSDSPGRRIGFRL